MATDRRRRYAPRLPAEERREQLLDAALGLVAEHGFGSASIEAIAREAGVTRPVVYDHFAGLAELLDALMRREERRALAQIATAIPLLLDQRDPDELLVDGIRTFLEQVVGSPATWTLILSPPTGTPPEVEERVTRNRGLVREQLAGILEWGIRRRGGPSVDVDLLARTVIVLAEEAGRIVLAEPDRYDPERLAGFVRTLLASLERGPGDPDAEPPPVEILPEAG